jgi:class 3 adenylate cyclase
MRKTPLHDAEQRKKYGSLFAFVFIPYWLNILGQRFVDMYLTAFAVPDAAGLIKRAAGGGGLAVMLMFILVYKWSRPSIRFMELPTQALKEKVRRLVDSVHRDAAVLLLLAWAGQVLYLRAAYGKVPYQVFPAFGLSLAVQFSVLPTIIDWVRARNKLLMELLYEKEELYTLRAGFSVPLSLKIGLLTFSCALLPFALSVAALKLGAPAPVWASVYYNLLAICAITLLLGLGVVFYGIQQPLDGLIARMRRLAAGDYSKTRIYFSDEVARLKAGFNDMADGLREREELQDTFGKYLSIEIARELIQNKKVNLGGEDMEAAVMFCDIRNFTPLSETMSAASLVGFLNDYFHYVTPPITANKGVINKFMGDAVMAIYTPLLGSADYAGDAVRAAVGMRRALAEYNASGKAPGRVDFGIGIHAGKLVAGNIGTAVRLEYTFIGDTVNIASRLESKTKDFGTDIIVSGQVLAKAGASLDGARFEPLGQVTLKGKSSQMELYKLV